MATKNPAATQQDLACEPSKDAWPIGKKAAFLTLFIVLLLGVLDMADRQVITALLPYLQKDFGLSDTQLGLLLSIVNIGLAVFALPAAYFIDKWSRKKMMGIMAFVWSFATAMCAFSTSFAQLLVCRLFVGAGEAGYGPAGQSLLVASFPEKYRATILACLNIGMTLGAPIGLAVGALIASKWGWQHAFGLFAIPGLILAFTALFIKDFKGVKKVEEVQGECVQLEAEKVNYLKILLNLVTKPTLAFAVLGQTTMVIVSTALMNWLPTYFVRVANATPSLAASLAASTMLISLVYMILYGVGADWLRRRIGMHNTLKVVALCGLIGFFGILLCFQFFTPASGAQLIMVMVYGFFLGPTTLTCLTVIADLSLPHHRASAASIMIVVQNIFGMAVGPTLMGFLSDRFDIVTAISLMAVCSLISGVLFLCASFTYKRDLARMEKVVVDF